MKTIYLFSLLITVFIASAQSDFSQNYTISNFSEVNTYFDEKSLQLLLDDAKLYLISTTRGELNNNGVWNGADKIELKIIDKNVCTPWNDNLNGIYDGGLVGTFEVNSNSFYLTAADKSGHSYIDLIECQHTCLFKNIETFKSNQYSFKDPNISKDGRFIYFSSDMPGGFGGFDLYMSFMEDGKWSAPINLGAGVNTVKDETSPFYHEQSGRVFFTSAGHDSFGGTDIFFCFNQGDSWTKAVNIGNHINSSNNETSIYFDDQLQLGFVASDKKSGKGGYDIYKIERNVQK